MAVVLPMLAVTGSFGLFFWLGAKYPETRDAKTAYVRDLARVRVCPSPKCKASTTFAEGRQVVIVRHVTGVSVDGSNEWVEIAFGDEARYVHSSLVATSPVAVSTTFWFIVTLLSLVTLPIFGWFVRSPKARLAAVRDDDQVDLLLLGGVTTLGIGLAAVGYLYARAGRDSSLSFLSSTFTNLGAGLIGAAVTFGLFQSLLSKRTPSAGEISERLTSLDDRLETLAEALQRPTPAHGTSNAVTARSKSGAIERLRARVTRLLSALRPRA